jgi:hypothetical protein
MAALATKQVPTPNRSPASASPVRCGVDECVRGDALAELERVRAVTIVSSPAVLAGRAPRS